LILVADNIQPMNPRVARALAERDPLPLQELARRCSAAGAAWNDVNPGFLPKSRLDTFAFAVEAIQQVSDARLVLDSAQVEALEVGLAACKQPPVINALTLGPDRLEGVLSMAAGHALDLIVLLLDADGQPPARLEDKSALAVELHARARAAGIETSAMIFDPLLPPLAWPDGLEHAQATIEAVQLLASGDLLGEPVRTLVGFSNLRSGGAQHRSSGLEKELLAGLKAAGLSHILANALDRNHTWA
jgi:5-methyltetrahydrofolate corrinoid/iron sulfur protein methyltransferase